jgi:putative endonuclease
MSNKMRTVLYTGVTNNLIRRYHEHRDGIVGGFTHKYRCRDLVYFEEYNIVNQAICREKEIKGWRREKKEELIKTKNPLMLNLAEEFGL